MYLKYEPCMFQTVPGKTDQNVSLFNATREHVPPAAGDATTCNPGPVDLRAVSVDQGMEPVSAASVICLVVRTKYVATGDLPTLNSGGMGLRWGLLINRRRG